MKKKRLLFVISSLSAGGAERVALHIVNNIDKGSYEVGLVLFKKCGQFLRGLGADIRIFDLRKRSRFDFILLIKKLISVINEFKPDFLISFLFYPNIISTFSVMFSESRPRLVLSEHSYKSDEFCPWWQRPVKRLLTKYAFRHAYYTIAVSKGIRQYLVQRLGIDADKVGVIYNPLDIDAINQLKQEGIEHAFFGANDSLTIISVTHLEVRKRVDMLLKAFTIARKELKLSLIIIGDGVLLPEMQQLAKKLGVEDFVFFAGHQDNPYKWLSRSDIFVLSSEREGLPTVLLEAFACGLPVIATDCFTGPREIIQDNINGILTPVNNAWALGKAIVRLAEDSSLRQRFSLAAKNRSLDFGLKGCVDGYQALFNR